MAAELSTDATDKSAGMTLAELQDFIDNCYRAGLDPTARVTAVVTLRARLKRVTASTEPD